MICDRLALLKTSVTEPTPVTDTGGSYGCAIGVRGNPRDSFCQQRRNGIPDLLGNLDLGPQKDKAVGKGLQAGGFPMSNRSMLFVVKISALFRFEELGPYREGRSIPPETSKQIGSTGLLSDPAPGREIRAPFLKIKSITSFRYTSITSKAFLGRRPAEMKIQRRRHLSDPDFSSYGFYKVPDGSPYRFPGQQSFLKESRCFL